MNNFAQVKEFRIAPMKKSDTTLPIAVGDPLDLILFDQSKRTVTVTAVEKGGKRISWDYYGTTTAIVATSTNGVMGSAGTVGALAAEGEKIGDDVRASIAAINTLRSSPGVLAEAVVGFDGAHSPALATGSAHFGGPFVFPPVVNANG